jgi:hypothetical protein
VLSMRCAVMRRWPVVIAAWRGCFWARR